MASSINASTTAGVVTTADTSGVLNLQTAGTTAIAIDASQNVGLGVTPSAWFASNKAFQIGSTGCLSNYTNGANIQTFLANNVYWNAAGTISYLTTNTATSYTQDNGTHKWYYAPSGTAGNAITFTQAMTLDASGNLGIGTTSPLKKLDVSVSTTASIGQYLRNSTINLLSLIDGTSSAQFGTETSHPLLFITGNIERTRLDSSGNFMVGTTSRQNATTFAVLSAGNVGEFRTSGGSCDVLSFYTSGSTLAGRINSNGSATSYVTSSDYRLKENIVPMTNALAVVEQLKPCTYSWKESGVTSQGFIAHELQEVVPDAVVGEKDAVNEDGSIKPQGIDTSFLVATLTAAIQEQQALITQLQADVAALKGA